MSAYMSFFIRVNDNFYPIGTYSRSTAIYEMFEARAGVPWEQIIPINNNLLKRISECVDENISGFKGEIESLYEAIKFLKSCEGDLSDKLQQYGYYKETIEDYEDRIEELKMVSNFIIFLESILDDGEGTKWYDEVETIDPSKYIYAGIEIGYATAEDIKED